MEAVILKHRNGKIGSKTYFETYKRIREYLDVGNFDRPIYGLRSDAFEKNHSANTAYRIRKIRDRKSSETHRIFGMYQDELHKLVAIGEEGAVIHNYCLKNGVKIARELIPKFEEIIRLHIDSSKGLDFFPIIFINFPPRLKIFSKRFFKKIISAN